MYLHKYWVYAPKISCVYVENQNDKSLWRALFDFTWTITVQPLYNSYTMDGIKLPV